MIWCKFYENWTTFNFGLYNELSQKLKRPLHNYRLTNKKKVILVFRGPNYYIFTLMGYLLWHFYKNSASLIFICPKMRHFMSNDEILNEIICRLDVIIMKSLVHGRRCVPGFLLMQKPLQLDFLVPLLGLGNIHFEI